MALAALPRTSGSGSVSALVRAGKDSRASSPNCISARGATIRTSRRESFRHVVRAGTARSGALLSSPSISALIIASNQLVRLRFFTSSGTSEQALVPSSRMQAMSHRSPAPLGLESCAASVGRAGGPSLAKASMARLRLLEGFRDHGTRARRVSSGTADAAIGPRAASASTAFWACSSARRSHNRRWTGRLTRTALGSLWQIGIR